MTPEEREQLRATLRSRMHAARINRMDKNSRAKELGKMEKIIKRETGQDEAENLDLSKVVNMALNK